MITVRLRTSFLAIVFAVSLVGCESKSPSEQTTSAVEPKPVVTPSVEVDTDPQWEQLKQDIGRARSLYMKNHAVERFLKTVPEDYPRRKDAEEMWAFLKARNHVNTFAISTAAREQKRYPKTKWEVSRLMKGGLTGMVEVVVGEMVSRAGSKTARGPEVGPFAANLPWGGEVTITKAASRSYGLGAVGYYLEQTLKRASTGEGAPDAWANPRTYVAQKRAFNAAFRPIAGGDIYQTSAPFHLNKKPAKRLAKKLDRLLGEEFVGLSVGQLAAIFSPTIRIYDDAYRELKAYGFKKALKEYRDDEPAKNEMYSRHRNWIKENGIADKIAVDPYYSSVAVGFWLRRLDDGTASYWRSSLDKIVKQLPPPAD